MHRRRDDDQATGVADECEAFLRGEYESFLTRGGHIPPAWTWLNLLAHGTRQQLEAASVPPFGFSTSSWTRARAFLCTEVLDAADEAGSLAEMQRRLLVPLELDLAASRPLRIWNSGSLVQLVLDEIDRHRQASRIRSRRAAR